MDKSNTSTDSKCKLLTWQQQAVDLLLLGFSQDVIAAELGIGQETLDSWCKEDKSSFAIALESRRQELQVEASSMENLFGQSIDRVERELNDNGSFEKEDVKVAFDIIKLLSPYKYLRISEQSV